jgi:hypothetical protein
MKADSRPICELTLDWLQSKVEDRLLISAVKDLSIHRDIQQESTVAMIMLVYWYQLLYIKAK